MLFRIFLKQYFSLFLKHSLTMKKSILTLLFFLIAISSFCQTSEKGPKFNLDFEMADKGNPIGWENFGGSNYLIALDSSFEKSGKYAASVEFQEGNPDFKALAFTLPENMGQ